MAVYIGVGFEVYFNNNSVLTPEERSAEKEYLDALTVAIQNHDIAGMHALMAQRAVDQRYDVVITPTPNGPVTSGGNINNRNSSFNLSHGAARDILVNLALPDYEGTLNGRVSALPLSQERAVLLSLEYNGVLDTSVNLLQAVTAGRRADAWFEIRYLTNPTRLTPNLGAGIQQRRFAESNAFGLYGASGLQSTPIETVMETVSGLTKRMHEIHHLSYLTPQWHPVPILTYSADFFEQMQPSMSAINTHLGTAGETFHFMNTSEGGALHPGIIDKNNVVQLIAAASVDTGAGNDVIFGSDGNDIILGGENDDTIYGGNGDDVINGGSHNDMLYGNAGMDTYVFHREFGTDVIFDEVGDTLVLDFSAYHSSEATLNLGSINPSIEFADGSIVTLPSLTIGISRIIFSDKEMDATQASTVAGTADDDYLFSYSLHVSGINGFGGNDRLFGNSATNILDGGEGNDQSWGFNGNDRLIGGYGTDVLIGGKGSDTYTLSNNLLINGLSNFDSGLSLFNVTEYTFDHVLIIKEGLTLNYNEDQFYNRYAGRYDQTKREENLGDVDVLDLSMFSLTDLNMSRYGSDLVVRIEAISALIIVHGQYISGLGGIETLIASDGVFSIDSLSENIEFSGGSFALETDNSTTLELNNTAITGNNRSHNIVLLGKHNQVNLGEVDDIIHATVENEINAGDGDDFIFLKNDFEPQNFDHYFYTHISGGAGDDTIWLNRISSLEVYVEGDTGDDLIVFGYGSSGLTIDGGSGNDHYVSLDIANLLVTECKINFSENFGRDCIDVKYAVPDLHFPTIDNITDLVFQKHNEDLYIIHGDDLVCIKGYYLLSANARQQSVIFLSTLQTKYYIEDRIENIATYTGVPVAPTVLPSVAIDPAELTGSAGRDVIVGSDGNDTLYGNGGDDRVFGGPGYDLLFGGDGNDVVYGGIGNDVIYSGNGNDLIYGDLGEDYISGGGDNDTIYGGMGNDNLGGDAGDDLIHGGDGYDYIQGGGGIDTLFGNDGDDLIFGGDGNDILHGNDGDDLVMGDAGDDSINGGFGNDNLIAGDGHDLLAGEDGNDFLSGDNGDDVLMGGGGDDYLDGGDGNDILQGGVGNDVYGFSGAMGHDTLFEEGGYDVLDIYNVANAESLSFSRDGLDLLITLGQEETILVKNSFLLNGEINWQNAVVEIRVTSSNEVLTLEDILSRVSNNQSMFNSTSDGGYESLRSLTSSYESSLANQSDNLIAAMAGFQPASSASSQPTTYAYLNDHTLTYPS